jgi:hypothetical protein
VSNENKCPNCGYTTRIAGTKEYVTVDPVDPTKATLSTEFNMICINPQCTLFAGNADDATVTVEFPYVKGDKTVVETEARPKVDFAKPKKIAKVHKVDRVVEVR